MIKYRVVIQKSWPGVRWWTEFSGTGTAWLPIESCYHRVPHHGKALTSRNAVRQAKRALLREAEASQRELAQKRLQRVVEISV